MSVWRAALGLAMLIAVAGCSGDDVGAPPATDPIITSPVITSPVITSPVTTSAVITSPVTLPGCELVPPDATTGAWVVTDCSVTSPDPASTLSLNVHFGEPDEGGDSELTIAVLDGGVPTGQTITQAISLSPAVVTLADLDRNGTDELLVPLLMGNVNVPQAVWTWLADRAEFVKASDEIGSPTYEVSADGYVMTLDRGAANIVDVQFLHFVGTELRPIATAELTGAEDEAGNVTWTCVLTDDGGLADVGLTLGVAQERLCAELDAQL
jgi:hypothetical protein